MEVKKTITSIFIVPTLGISKEKLVNNGYINGYMKDNRKDVQYENSVYLLFKPTNLDVFREFLDEEYERSKQVIDDYDYEDGFIVVVYTLNSKLENDIKLIKQGKYSQTSPAFQSIFPKIVKLKRNGYMKDEVSLQYRIFNKTPDLKQFWEDKFAMELEEDMEVWEGFFEENESLDFDKIKEHV